jgi:UDP-glucose 4-epimerase
MGAKPTIVITGPTGLLGKQVIKFLCSNHEVHVMVRDKSRQMDSRVTKHVIDLSENWSADCLPDQVDIVIHLAQSDRFRDFPDGATDVFKVNIESTARLLDYASRAGCRQFIYASSGGLYGNGSQPFDENSPIVPPGQLGYYLGSKLCGEVLSQSYASQMQIIILRFFFMYGLGQKRSMLIPRLIDNIKAGNPVTLESKEGLRINPVHVSDAASAVAVALRTEESATYNIAGPEVLSLREIAEVIGTQVGVRPLLEISDGPPNDLIGKNAAMCEKLIEPSVGFERGIGDLL